MAGKNLSNYHNIQDPRVREKRKAIQDKYREHGEAWVCDCGAVNVGVTCVICDDETEAEE